MSQSCILYVESSSAPADCLVSLGPVRSEPEDGAVPVAREQRKLAAILAADVVGYSRLIGRDESGTLARCVSIGRNAWTGPRPLWRSPGQADGRRRPRRVCQRGRCTSVSEPVPNQAAGENDPANP